MAPTWITTAMMPGPPEPCGAMASSSESGVMRLPLLLSLVVAAPPVVGPHRVCITAALNRGTHLRRQADQIPHVVQRQQAQTEQLAGHEQMPQIPARVRRARFTI